MLWRKKKNQKTLQIRIVRESAPWNEADTAALATFLAGPTGKKVLAKLEHSIYNECISTEHLSDLKRGTAQGLALAVGGIRNMAMQHYGPIDEEDSDDDDDQEEHFQPLY